MPQATFVQEGASIDYMPAADVATGDVVVQGDLVGVAKLDIKTNKLGALAVAGVFDFARTGGTVYTVGMLMYWDDTNNVATNVATGNKLLGKAVRISTPSDATVRIRLSQ
jgi:predicted RecA/RadA family phage recombinase